ncbi:hypothetical protein GCM10008965_16780 [Methylorubrum aminovorans]
MRVIVTVPSGVVTVLVSKSSAAPLEALGCVPVVPDGVLAVPAGEELFDTTAPSSSANQLAALV